MEVLHGDIRITLSDEEAIRGVERLRATVKRQMSAIARERAVVSIEGNLRVLKRDLREAKKELSEYTKNWEDLGAEEKAHAKNLQQTVKTLEKQTKHLQDHVDSYKQTNKEAALHTREIELQERASRDLGKQIDANNKKLQTEGQLHARALEEDRKRSKQIQDNYQKEGQLQARARREDEQRTKAAQDAIQKEGQLRSRAAREMESDFARRDREQKKHEMDLVSEQAKVAKLQQEYNKAFEYARRLDRERRSLRGRAAEASAPAIKQEVELKQARAIGEMEVLRAKLKALGHEPIPIETKLDERNNLVSKLAGIGDIGTRIGPFAGSLAQMGKALLALGPIITGVVGYLGALTGAIGAGLTGAIGLATGGLAAFGLSLGGVGALTASLFRDFKNLNTLQDAYHKQVLKTGANSDKAKNKLKEFNHALGEVTPTTHDAFMALDKLQDRWRGLRKDVRPDFMNTLGQAIKTVNADFGIFAGRTKQAFSEVAKGFQNWFKAMRSREAQGILDTLMENANAAIPPLMHGLGELAGAVARVATSFSRYLKPQLDRFDRWATHVNKATDNMNKVDGGVDKMMHSFQNLWDVLVGVGRVLEQFMLSAMGPGGKAMSDLADGLNGIADAMAADRAGPNKLGKFLHDSVDTSEKLYHAVQPLLKLFLEFTTIMRPFTDALLSIIGPLAQLTQHFLALEPVRIALQAWAGLWLLNRGTIGLFSNLASAARLLATSMKTIAGLKIVGMIPGLQQRLLGGSMMADRFAGRSTRGAEKLQGGVDDAIARRMYSYPGEVAPKPETVASKTKGAFSKGWAMARPGLFAVSGLMLGGAAIAGASSAIRGHNWKEVWQDAMSGATLGILPGASERQAKTTADTIDGLKKKLNELATAGNGTHWSRNSLAEQLRTGEIFSGKVVQKFNIMKFNIAEGLKYIAKHADDLGPAGKRAADTFLQNIRTIQNGIGTLRASGGDNIRTLREVFDKNMRAIAHSMGSHSAAGAKSAQQSFNAFAGAVKRAMDRGVVTTKEGLAAISDAFQSELKAIGYKGDTAAVMNLRRYQDIHGRGTGQGMAKAVGGYVGQPGQHGRDTIPLLVGAGEAVLNRHQQTYVNAALSATGMPGGLTELFQRENTPHYMAGGGFVKAANGMLPRPTVVGGGVLNPIVQARIDKYRKTAQSKLDEAMSLFSGGGESSTHGLTGQVLRAIRWARSHGWKGKVTSGFRSRNEQAILYARYLAGGPLAARPGSSNHERGRAIDVTDQAGFNRAMQSAPANARLIWFGPRDPVHFSIDGHARGGFAKAARGKPGKHNAKRQPGNFSATSYGPPWGGIQGNGVTTMGVNLTKAPHKYGIAVDPHYIPLGSEVFVWPNPFNYKGKFRAFDTGGAIKGRRIDFYDWRGRKAQNAWGRRSVSVSWDRLSTSQQLPKSARQPAPKTFGPTSNFENVIAEQQGAVDMSVGANEYGPAALNQASLRYTLGKQNIAANKRISQIDQKLKGRLTADDRQSLLSERSSLIGQVNQNQQTRKELMKSARDNAFEFLRGKGKRATDVEYKKAMAGETKTLDDDKKAALADQDYWAARIKFLRKQHATQAEITDAINNYNSATQSVQQIQEQIDSDRLDAMSTQASLTSGLDDDLDAAKAAQTYYQTQYDLAVAAGDNAGIAKWGAQLKSANDQVKDIAQQIQMLPLETNQMMASLTNDLNDDVVAARDLVGFWQGVYGAATGADKVSAGQSLSGALNDLKQAQRTAETLPLERDQALAALTTTMDDDNAALVKLRDYWKGQLDTALSQGNIQDQIEAANNLKSLNDQIDQAQQTVAAQMVSLSQARSDLYKAFATNVVSLLPTGFSVPGNSSTDNSKSVTVINNFQSQPEDPHTWSAGVNWELQAAV